MFQRRLSACSSPLRARDAAESRLPILQGYVSFGPHAPIGELVDGDTAELSLCLGDDRDSGPLYYARAAADDLVQLLATYRGQVRLKFPQGDVPPLPGPIPVWNRGIIGHVWGLRPTNPVSARRRRGC